MVYADELDVDKDFGWPVWEMKKRDGTPKNPESRKFRRQRERDLTRKKEARTPKNQESRKFRRQHA